MRKLLERSIDQESPSSVKSVSVEHEPAPGSQRVVGLLPVRLLYVGKMKLKKIGFSGIWGNLVLLVYTFLFVLFVSRQWHWDGQKSPRDYTLFFSAALNSFVRLLTIFIVRCIACIRVFVKWRSEPVRADQPTCVCNFQLWNSHFWTRCRITDPLSQPHKYKRKFSAFVFLPTFINPTRYSKRIRIHYLNSAQVKAYKDGIFFFMGAVKLMGEIRYFGH